MVPSSVIFVAIVGLVFLLPSVSRPMPPVVEARYAVGLVAGSAVLIAVAVISAFR